MDGISADETRRTVDAVYRDESRRVLATLIRLLGGNFDQAEEAMHDAFAAAVVQWPRDGIPDNPRAWLVSAGRFKAIDSAALAMRDGPEAGLARIDEILAAGTLDNYHLAHAARADLCRRLGKRAEARVSYERALELVQQEPERRFLERRLLEL